MPRKKGPNEKAMSIADQEVLDHYGQLIRKYGYPKLVGELSANIRT